MKPINFFEQTKVNAWPAWIDDQSLQKKLQSTEVLSRFDVYLEYLIDHIS